MTSANDDYRWISWRLSSRCSWCTRSGRVRYRKWLLSWRNKERCWCLCHWYSLCSKSTLGSTKGTKDPAVDLSPSLILETHHRPSIFTVGVDIHTRWFCGRSRCSRGGGGCGRSRGGGSFFTEQTELGTLLGGPVFVVETDWRTVTLTGVYLVLTDVVM